MKTIPTFGTIAVSIILLFGCSPDHGEEINSDNSILGKWKLVEARISDGGPMYPVIVKDGDEYKFSENGVFTSTIYPECSGGNFKAQEEELTLNYDCDGFNNRHENEEGAITFKMTFESGYLILIPTSVICIEGCSYKYKRL